MQVARTFLLTASVVLAVALAGCGSSANPTSQSSKSSEAATRGAPAPAGASARSCTRAVAGVAQLQVTGVDCDAGRRIAVSWAGRPVCFRPSGASRYACGVLGAYRCLGTATERGIAVSCARPSSSVAFVAKRG